jgi:hypothetical protein
MKILNEMSVLDRTDFNTKYDHKKAVELIALFTAYDEKVNRLKEAIE